jgi:hypothetical protein
MASLYVAPNGCKTIQFTDADRQRHTIRLGKVSLKLAQEIKIRVEHLKGRQQLGGAIDNDTARWLAKCRQVLIAKLAKVRLAEPRQTSRAALADWLKEYRTHRADVSGGTSTNYGIVANRLTSFFSVDKPLHAIRR